MAKKDQFLGRDEMAPRAKAPKTLGGDFEAPRMNNDWYQEPTRPPDTIGIDPADGLPRQMPSRAVEDNEAPALSPERFVCMVDASEYVVRNELGAIKRRYALDKVERAENGRYFVARRWQRWAAAGLAGPLVVMNVLNYGFSTRVEGLTLASLLAAVLLVILIMVRSHVWVEPLRPQCGHYFRQLIPVDDNRDYTKCNRYCAAIKDEHGEMFTLGDQEVLACEFRTPRWYAADKKIDEFDQLVVLRSKKTTEEFDVDQALADEVADGGIFNG